MNVHTCTPPYELYDHTHNELIYFMANILIKKQKNLDDQSFKTINDEKNTLSYSSKEEYKNIIFYPSSSKEWFNNVYSYNKSYIKPLIAYDKIVKKLFNSYCNMLQDKLKIRFKRRHHNKSRYSANKTYVSRPELKHTNTKLYIILYTYNKQKSTIERFIIKFLNDVKSLKILAESNGKYIVKDIDRFVSIYKNKILFSKKVDESDNDNDLVLDQGGNRKLIYLVTH